MAARKTTAPPKMDLHDIIQDLPPVFGRTDLKRLFGTILAPGFLANLDSRGEGPPRFRIGRRIGYKRDEFIRWLEARAVRIPLSQPKIRPEAVR